MTAPAEALPRMTGLEMLAKIRSDRGARITAGQHARALSRFKEATAHSRWGAEHADIGLALTELEADEHTRHARPNRRVLRAYGERGRYAKRWHIIARMGAQSRRLDAIEDSPPRAAKEASRKAAAAERKLRVEARVAARRERLGL